MKLLRQAFEQIFNIIKNSFLLLSCPKPQETVRALDYELQFLPQLVSLEPGMVEKLSYSTCVIAAHAANSPWGNVSPDGKQLDYDYESDNLPQNGTCSGLLHGESTCPIGSLCMSAENGLNFDFDGCLQCNAPFISMASFDDCKWFADQPLEGNNFTNFDTGSAYGTVNLVEMCYGQCLGRPELTPPYPEGELPCATSTDCRDVHHLGHWMCNFDHGETGFCEPCDTHPDEQACIASTFITETGTNECLKVCVNGIYDEHPPTEMPFPDDALICQTSIDCRDGYELDHWMCNFDRGYEGFCEPCENLVDYDACMATGFITEAGTNECLKVCVDGYYGDDITTTETTTSTRPRSTTTPSTTTGSSCAQFDFIHDFLAQTGAAHFQSIFTNEQDSFSRRPGRETHGLKRRKIQFTQWIDNVFVKMSKHLEKRSFINCFEANGRLFDGGMVISEEFDQCPMIEATTIDEYFENLLVFVDWFYADCGNGMSGKLAEKLHHRWNRINEIKMEVQNHIDNKNGRLHIQFSEIQKFTKD